MGQRLGDRLVGVLELGVLADDRDPHLALGVVDAVDDVLPLREVRPRRRRDREGVEHRPVEPLGMIGERRLVDRAQVLRRDHRLRPHVAEQRQLLALLRRDRHLRAADQHVGRDADRAQLLHRVLRRLGLQLAGRRQVGQQRQVHVDALAPRLVLAELPDRLEERQPLDVADGAADLAEHEVDLVLADPQEVLDLVGDVRDDLDGLAEVVAAPLLLQHVGVDPPRGDRVGPPRRHPGEALVVPEVEVGLRPVVGHEHLAMLERRHRARIDVEVGVELPEPHRIAARLQQRPERRRREALAERRDHAARDEDVPRHSVALPRLLVPSFQRMPDGFTGLNLYANRSATARRR